MIVQPDLVTHPKFLTLKTIIGECAMEVLIRLWAHCQQCKRSQAWEGASAEYVELVTAGRDMNGRVFSALVKTGFLERTENGIVVHDWDDYNAALKSNWNRNRSGHPTAPSPTTPTGHPTAPSPTTPTGHPTAPSRDTPIGLDRIGLDRKVQEEGGGGADFARSKAQWAALSSLVKEMEANLVNLSDVERAELRKNRAALKELVQKQAEGKFG